MPPERSLIEEYLPIRAVSYEATREKLLRRRDAHISMLHIWWARRPLAAARAAVYGALVPPPERLDHKKLAQRFQLLCTWGGPTAAIEEAREEVLRHNGGAAPKVLDMFAGGGAIPLEATRLGCDAYAVELNPVAHLIELCTLVYPQRYGPSLADDVARWGNWMIERVKAAVGDLYPDIEDENGRRLTPIAYLWTRTVPCPNPAAEPHDVDLVRQTWLVKKKGRYLALRPIVDRDTMEVRYELPPSAIRTDDLGFDPEAGSKRGSTTCTVCGAAAGVSWAKREGKAGHMGRTLMAVAALRDGQRGKTYFESERAGQWPDDADIERRIASLGRADDLEPPVAPLPDHLTGGTCVPYGFNSFADLFTPRQMLTLLTFCKEARSAHGAMLAEGMEPDRAAAVASYLGLAINRIADRSSVLCRWDNSAEKTSNTFARQALPMVWDFSEVNPFGGSSGDAATQFEQAAKVIRHCAAAGQPATVVRGSATNLPFDDESMDAVVTDPPYYDNISYADLSDFFYVWLKRSVGHLHPEHFGSETTPKRREAVVARYRHEGDQDAARRFYEEQMQEAFNEAHRVLKPGAPLVCVYAHKTTLGWSTLVRALQKAGFTVTEAWPLDTEMPDRVGQMHTASLASSIFLVGRKRTGQTVGDADEVLEEVRGIVAERIRTLQDAGVVGADLVIAAVGAGLRAYTKHERVERANGEELDPESYLQEVQRAVLEEWGRELNVADADRTSRFYVFAMREYGFTPVPFDEVNTLARGVGVELSGPGGLTDGDSPLVGYGKNRSEARLRDYSERGERESLGEGGSPLIDVLHRLLWLRTNRPAEAADFIRAAQPDAGRLKVLAQALAGEALDTAGNGLTDEQRAIQRLLAAWPQAVNRPLEDGGGQQRMAV